jgi:hypothetical protein
MGGSIRFSEGARLPPESDFSRWPGVYVHPGTFKHTADRPRDEEAWEKVHALLKGRLSRIQRRERKELKRTKRRERKELRRTQQRERKELHHH